LRRSTDNAGGDGERVDHGTTRRRISTVGNKKFLSALAA